MLSRILLALLLWSSASLHAQLQWSFTAPVKDQGDSLRLVWFHAAWCGPCKQMEKEAFADPEVQKLMGQFSLHDLDEAKPEAAGFAKEYRIRGFPTLLVLTSSGRELRRSLGYEGLMSTKEFLQDGLSGSDLLVELKGKVANPETAKSTDTYLEFANTLLDRGHFDELNTVVRSGISDPIMLPIVSSLRGLHINAKRMNKEFRDARILASAYYKAARSDQEVLDAIWHIGRIAKDEKTKVNLFPLRFEAWQRFPSSLSLARDVVRDAPKELAKEELLPIRDRATQLLRLSEPAVARDRLQSVLADLLVKTGQNHDAHRLLEELVEKHPDEEFYKQKLERFRNEYPLGKHS